MVGWQLSRIRCETTVQRQIFEGQNFHGLAFFERFLLGTGRMPHPVGGAMGVTLYTAVPRVKPALTSAI